MNVKTCDCQSVGVAAWAAASALTVTISNKKRSSLAMVLCVLTLRKLFLRKWHVHTPKWRRWERKQQQLLLLLLHRQQSTAPEQAEAAAERH
jgi:hypothetical protein